METAPFRLRRVFAGVLVGLVVVVVAFFGWVQYSRSQYHDHETATLNRYQQRYSLCLTAGRVQFICATQVYDACLRDPFWRGGQPFSLELSSRPSDPAALCRRSVAGSR